MCSKATTQSSDEDETGQPAFVTSVAVGSAELVSWICIIIAAESPIESVWVNYKVFIEEMIQPEQQVRLGAPTVVDSCRS